MKRLSGIEFKKMMPWLHTLTNAATGSTRWKRAKSLKPGLVSWAPSFDGADRDILLAMVACGISVMYGKAVDNDAATEIDQTTTSTPNAVVTPTDKKVIDNSQPAGKQMQTATTDGDPTSESGTGGDSPAGSRCGNRENTVITEKHMSKRERIDTGTDKWYVRRD